LSFETASNIFIQNRALLVHIHLHLLGASFTKLKQGPFYQKAEIRKIQTKRDTSNKYLRIRQSYPGVPKFQEQDLALGESLKLDIWDIGLLVLFNLLFFAADLAFLVGFDSLDLVSAVLVSDSFFPASLSAVFFSLS